MFKRFDPEFPARAEAWGGGIVVGGHNYGQGSSREQAAFAALHLGVRAIVARSFARIHRTNLIAQAIPPLVLSDEAPGIEQGDEWRIEGLADAVRGGGREVVAATPYGEVRLGLELSARERAILLAGGLIVYARA